MFEYSGKAYCFGDNINTDYIISSRRKKDTINPQELVKYIMEDIRPGFSKEFSGKNILVAGENFGCGSAMEVAAQVVKSAGFDVVLAKSFARSFYRNAINNGIIPVEIDTSDIKENDNLRVEMNDTTITVSDLNENRTYTGPAFNGKVKDILLSGGIVNYIKNNFSRDSHKEDLHG